MIISGIIATKKSAQFGIMSQIRDRGGSQLIPKFIVGIGLM